MNLNEVNMLGKKYK